MTLGGNTVIQQRENDRSGGIAIANGSENSTTDYDFTTRISGTLLTRIRECFRKRLRAFVSGNTSIPRLCWVSSLFQFAFIDLVDEVQGAWIGPFGVIIKKKISKEPTDVRAIKNRLNEVPISASGDTPL